MQYLIDDCLCYILRYVTFKDNINWSLVNHYFYHQSKNELLWKQYFTQKFEFTCSKYHYESFKYLYNRCLYQFKRGVQTGFSCGKTTQGYNYCDSCYTREDKSYYDINVKAYKENLYINLINNFIYKVNNDYKYCIGKLDENNNIIQLTKTDYIECQTNCTF